MTATVPMLSCPHALWDAATRQLIAASPGFLEVHYGAGAEILNKWGITPTVARELPPTLEAMMVYAASFENVYLVRLRGSQIHLLLVHRHDYDNCPDPFAWFDRCPAPWGKKSLETDYEIERPHFARRVEDLAAILRDGDSPLLLAAAQNLVDGGKIALVRGEPQNGFLRDLWQLLPYSTQFRLEVASYLWKQSATFSVHISDREHLPLRGYLREEQILDYPESFYERNLQIAIEAGDQRAVNKLFNRRNNSQVIQLAVVIMVGMMTLALSMALLS